MFYFFGVSIGGKVVFILLALLSHFPFFYLWLGKELNGVIVARFILASKNRLNGRQKNALQEKDGKNKNENRSRILIMVDKSGILHIFSIS